MSKRYRCWWDELVPEPQATWSLWLTLPAPLSRLCMTMLWSWPYEKVDRDVPSPRPLLSVQVSMSLVALLSGFEKGSPLWSPNFDQDALAMQQTCKTVYAAIKDQQMDNRQVILKWGKAADVSRFPPLWIARLHVRTVAEFSDHEENFLGVLRLYSGSTHVQLDRRTKASAPVSEAVVKQLLGMRNLTHLSSETSLESLISCLTASRAPIEELGIAAIRQSPPVLWTPAIAWHRWPHIKKLDIRCCVGDDSILKIMNQCSKLEDLGLYLDVHLDLDAKVHLRKFVADIATGIFSAGSRSLVDVNMITAVVGNGKLDVKNDASLASVLDAWFKFPDMVSFMWDLEEPKLDSIARIGPHDAVKEFERGLSAWSSTIKKFVFIGIELHTGVMMRTMDLAPHLINGGFRVSKNSRDLTVFCTWLAKHPMTKVKFETETCVFVSKPLETDWKQLHRGFHGTLFLDKSAQGLRLSQFAHALRHQSLSLRGNAPCFEIDDAAVDMVGESQLCLVVSGKLAIHGAFIATALAKRMKRIVIVRNTDEDSMRAFHHHNVALMDLDRLDTLAETVSHHQVVVDGLYAAERLERKRPWTIELPEFMNSEKKIKRHVRMCAWNIQGLIVYYGEAKLVSKMEG